MENERYVKQDICTVKQDIWITRDMDNERYGKREIWKMRDMENERYG